MINRNLTSPILFAVVLSLVVPFSVSADLKPAPQADSIPPETISPANSLSENTGSSQALSSDIPSGPVGAPEAGPTTLAAHTTTYTVVKGDSLTRIAEKFNTTRKKLEALNNLTASKITAGQVILVPSYKKKSKSAIAANSPAIPPKLCPQAQPVQPFDTAPPIGSSAAPVRSEASGSSATEKPAPIAKLVSPSELAADMAQMQAENDALAAEKRRAASAHTETAPRSAISSSAPALTTPSRVTDAPSGLKSDSSPAYLPSARSANRNTGLVLGQNPAINSSTNAWASRFLQQARILGSRGLEYDEDWRPPGERTSWTMDCSNTARYLYKVTAGIELPRTASDQYYYLHLQGKAWDVPRIAMGMPDTNYLRDNLKPGDLLFWENTYRPERQPPITHVMVFLGTNEQGQWIMAGSQNSSGGEHNRRNGGPDIYIFRPSQPCGGYSTWLGMVHHRGRFCAFGRPLEADRSKLSVAANN